MFEGLFHKKEAPAGDDGVAGGSSDEKEKVYAVDPKTGLVHMGEEGESEREVAERARDDFGKGEKD